MEESVLRDNSVNIEDPKWDQGTYWGRAKHFFTITNPLNLLVTSKELDRCKDIVTKYRRGEVPEGLTVEELWRAKHIYDSAFHPDTGEKMVIFGRMSAQVPMNMLITGCMMTFYKSFKEVVFWQWCNQSFNAIVNYSNRSGDSPISTSQLGKSYVLATGGALITGLSLNSLVKKAHPLIGRYVPFAAVAAANCVNIPMMRMRELQEGINLLDSNGNCIGSSASAAKKAFAMVIVSRIGMCAPGMVLIPIFMNALEKRGILKRYPRISAPLQVMLCGFMLTFATPLCCAIFPQVMPIAVNKLEPHIQDKINLLPNPPTVVYYNKGL